MSIRICRSQSNRFACVGDELPTPESYRKSEDGPIRKLIYPVIAAIIIALDQLTKHLVRSNMDIGEAIPIIGSWLNLRYVQNTGTAFSMFSGNKWITLALAGLLIVLCLVFIVAELRKAARPTSGSAARTASILALIATLVAAGGIGNMIDRLTLGYVTDMISCGSFAIFNVADIFITCGCFAGMIYILYLMKIGEDF